MSCLSISIFSFYFFNAHNAIRKKDKYEIILKRKKQYEREKKLKRNKLYSRNNG